jgi:hypothetical protein
VDNVVAFLICLGILAVILGLLRRRRTSRQSKTRYQSNTHKPGTVIERNQRIILDYLNRISSENTGWSYLEDEARKCIADVAWAEGRPALAPEAGEQLSKWEARPTIPEDYCELKRHVEKLFRERHDALKAEQKSREDERTKSLTEALAERNADLIQKFLDIAERKVSTLDDYGDEHWDALPREIVLCLRKIGEREGLWFDWEKYGRDRRKEKWSILQYRLPKEYQFLETWLTEKFREFHETHRTPAQRNSSNLSGEEFETLVAKLLRERGYEVLGTPRSGDQGADLIAKRGGKTIIIQAKCYAAPVGNKAVQEAASARIFYRGDEAWVVTNSTFTPSAKALARKAGVRLVEGSDLSADRIFA